MVVSDYNKRINKLFIEWQEHQKKDSGYDSMKSKIARDSFTTDGAISPEDYFSANKRILVVSKESHIKEGEKFTGEFWLKDVYNDVVPARKFARRIAMSVKAVIENDFDNVDNDYKNLKYVAFMNLNKRGGHSTCNPDILATYVSEYHEEIKKEIEILNPEIIICAGKGVKEQLENIGVKDYKIVETYHPSYFVKSDKDHLEKLRRELHDK